MDIYLAMVKQIRAAADVSALVSTGHLVDSLEGINHGTPTGARPRGEANLCSKSEVRSGLALAAFGDSPDGEERGVAGRRQRVARGPVLGPFAVFP